MIFNFPSRSREPKSLSRSPLTWISTNFIFSGTLKAKVWWSRVGWWSTLRSAIVWQKFRKNTFFNCHCLPIPGHTSYVALGIFLVKNVNDDCEVTPASIRPTSTDLRLFNHELIFWYAIRHTVTILRYAILRPDVKWLWSLESAKIPPMRYLTISSNEVFSLKKVEWSRISWHKWRFKACSCKLTDGCRSL